MIVAYVCGGLALACFVAALRGVPFPFGHVALPSAPPVPLTEEKEGLLVEPQPVAERTDVTAEEVMRLFEGRTALQAKQLLKSYLGAVLRLSGNVETVSESHGLTSVTFMEPYEVFMFFPKADEQPLLALHKGDRIEVEGKLQDANVYSVVLKDCKLISVEGRR